MDVIIWSGFAGGAAIGLYMLLQYVLTGKALGVSTGYGNVCGMVSKTKFFHTGKFKELNNWRLWFLIGLPLGGLIALLTSGGSFEPTLSMGLYDTVMPSASWARGLVLLGGGVLIGLGARMAGGCTSGHTIAGISMLNPPSVLASVGFFVGGVVAVQLLFGVLA